MYRVAFEDGSAYVGQTSRLVIERIEEHFGARYGTDPFFEVPMSERLASGLGTLCIVERLAVCLRCTIEVLHSDLTPAEADEREWAEIGELSRPLNSRGPVRPWLDLAFERDPGDGAMARLQRARPG